MNTVRQNPAGPEGSGEELLPSYLMGTNQDDTLLNRGGVINGLEGDDRLFMFSSTAFGGDGADTFVHLSGDVWIMDFDRLEGDTLNTLHRAPTDVITDGENSGLVFDHGTVWLAGINVVEAEWMAHQMYTEQQIILDSLA